MFIYKQTNWYQIQFEIYQIYHGCFCNHLTNKTFYWYYNAENSKQKQSEKSRFYHKNRKRRKTIKIFIESAYFPLYDKSLTQKEHCYYVLSLLFSGKNDGVKSAWCLRGVQISHFKECLIFTKCHDISRKKVQYLILTHCKKDPTK